MTQQIDLSYYALIREIHSYSSLLDVGVELVRVKDAKTFVPHVTLHKKSGKRTIHLLQPEATWTEQRILQWRGDFYHEMGHFHPNVMDIYPLLAEKNLNPESMFFKGMNCFDDHRQEKNEHGAYAGRDITLSRTYQLDVQQMIFDTLGNKLKQLDGKGDASITMAMMWMTIQGRENWQRDVSGMGATLKSKFSDPMQGKIKQLEDGDFVQKLEEVKTANDVYELVRDVLKLFERDPDEEEKQAQNGEQGGEGTGEESGQGEGESGSGTGSSDGDGEVSSAQQQDSQGNSKNRAKERANQDAKISWRDIKIHEHDTEKKPSYSKVEIDYNGYDGHNEGFSVAEKLNVADYVNDTGDVLRSVNSYYMSRLSSVNIHTGLANKIRKLLQVKTQTLTINGQKKGKLAARAMHKVAMHGTGAYRERVFKKKIQQFDLDTAVSVVVDFSGSMGGDKMKHAITSALMLNEAISKIGVPVEIIGFTDHSTASDMSIFKVFDRKISNEKLKENMCKATGNMSGNADGEAILWAYHRLAKQKNKRKLMIVLSDGQPAAHRGMCSQFTKDVVKNIENEKRAEIYGIGIQSSSVKQYYKHHAVIRHTDELESAVINVIKNHILK